MQPFSHHPIEVESSDRSRYQKRAAPKLRLQEPWTIPASPEVVPDEKCVGFVSTSGGHHPAKTRLGAWAGLSR